MNTGYGRGFYGEDQLAPRRSRSGWWTAALVAGIGGAAWYLWFRKKPEPALVVITSPTPTPTAPAPADTELDAIARSRGFSSTKAFEDSIVSTARSLRASGAQIDLGPYLQHLMPRVETP